MQEVTFIQDVIDDCEGAIKRATLMYFIVAVVIIVSLTLIAQKVLK